MPESTKSNPIQPKPANAGQETNVSKQAEPVCAPGALHPDLFGEDTPIMEPLDTPLAVYRVSVGTA